MISQNYKVCSVVFTGSDFSIRGVTIGKIYYGYRLDSGLYYLMDDSGNFCCYDCRDFTEIDDWREEQIKKVVE